MGALAPHLSRGALARVRLAYPHPVLHSDERALCALPQAFPGRESVRRARRRGTQGNRRSGSRARRRSRLRLLEEHIDRTGRNILAGIRED